MVACGVTEAGGTLHGLGGVDVTVYAPSAGDGAAGTTAVNGSYTVKGLLAAADYRVCFSGSAGTGGSSDARGYVAQCYNNQPASGTPTPVTVTLGATRAGVNAALVGGGAVSGVVTDAGGTHQGLAGVGVNV